MVRASVVTCARVGQAVLPKNSRMSKLHPQIFYDAQSLVNVSTVSMRTLAVH
jgi:hypothetical protein